MIVFGLRVLDTPPFLEKKCNSLTTLSTIWIFMSFPASLFHYPDPTLDPRYVLVGTCQIDHMATWNGFNQGLERCEFTIGMYCRDMETTLKKSLNICGTVLSARWLTVVKHILRLSVKKTGIFFMNKMLVVINTSLWRFNNSLGTFT
jgi:hypothetical protein